MEAGPGLRFNAVLELLVLLGSNVSTRSGEGSFSLRAKGMAPSERGKRNVLADWDVAYKIKETVQKLKFLDRPAA